MKKNLIILCAAALVVTACSSGSGTDSPSTSSGASGTTAEPAITNPAFGPVTVDGSLPAQDDPNNDTALGMPAPSLSGVDPTGAPVEFVPGANPTMLVFVAHWCPHCQAEIPRIVDWLEANPDRAGVDIIAVATGTREGQANFPPSAWLYGESWTQPIIMDDEQASAAVAFGLTSFPFIVAVDAEGNIQRRIPGETSPATFDAAVRALAAG